MLLDDFTNESFGVTRKHEHPIEIIELIVNAGEPGTLSPPFKPLEYVGLYFFGRGDAQVQTHEGSMAVMNGSNSDN